ncbi:hypothetical protein [Cognatishimia sp. MH4019]|uniref:hypothetical protein n=1 Tax=Cognatishimia sp. MH4019 TaxID=2854030 RepID=UPI001CD46E91|nr:hypothetical protein [Cognatishimia sp. MH4019]
MILPFSLFWLGALVTILMIRRANNFSIKETVRAAIGMRGYKRTGAITAGQLLTLTVPLGLWLVLIQACRA